MQKFLGAILTVAFVIPVAGQEFPERRNVPTVQRFFAPTTPGGTPENRRGTPQTLDIENSSYAFGRYEDEDDLPNPYAGDLGTRIRVAAGERQRSGRLLHLLPCAEARAAVGIQDFRP